MGARVEPKPKDSQQAVLYALLAYVGGPTKMQKLLQKKLKDSTISTQLFTNWARRGAVPAKQALRISGALGVSPVVLNYSEVSSFYPSAPRWETLVKELTFLDRKTRERILAKKHPK